MTKASQKDNIITHTNNILKGAVEQAKMMGYAPGDSIDLLTKRDLPINGYSDVTQRLSAKSVELGSIFSRIIDNYMRK